MAFTKSTKDMNVIAALSDEPNVTDGLTAEQLKAKFDEAVLALQTDFNNLVDGLHSTTNGSSGAENIGSTAIAGLTGTTIHDQLSNLLAVAQEAAAGTIPDGSITDVKLSDTAGQIKSKVANHVADNLYQVAGGTATALTLTIATTLVDGFPVNFIASANNGGVATTINSKNLYKAGGTNPVTLIKDKPYTVVYNLAGDCFFLKASAEGDAVAANVLAGKTFSNDADTGLTGAMVNNGAVTITPGTSNQFITEGYHDGTGYVKGDLDLVAENIKKDVNIFNIIGTFDAKRWAKGTKAAGSGDVAVSGLTFQPNIIIMRGGISTDIGTHYCMGIYVNSTYLDASRVIQFKTLNTSTVYALSITTSLGGFTSDYNAGSYVCDWFACE